MQEKRKTFFRQSTLSEIKKKDFVEVTGLLEILNLKSNEYTIIKELVPRGYESARKFVKHGPEVKSKRFYTLEQALKDGRTPVQLREDAFDGLLEKARKKKLIKIR